MIGFLRVFRALYAELSERPMLAFALGTLGASFIGAYLSERERLQSVVAETVSALNGRAGEIEARIARAKVSEDFAASTGELDEADWRELHRIMVRR